VKPTVDISAIDVATPPRKTGNSLEFMLTTFSRALNLKPVTAAGFFANKNQFLL